MNLKWGLNISAFALVAVLLACSPALATPEYSGRTGQGCRACHIHPTGGELSEEGLEFAASGYIWPPEGGYRVLGPIRKSVRLLIGFLHITASFMWFGTILYVHIVLRPGYASKGLPRGEMVMGLVTMAVVGITGLLLTVSRIKGPEVLYESPWGVLLSIKIILYAVMVLSALFVVAFVGPRLRKSIDVAAGPPKSGVFGPGILQGFDGQDGRPAYVAFRDKVYDVTGLKLWEDGKHMKHLAGRDLTGSLSKAPHGDEKLKGLRSVGTFDSSGKPPLSPAQKAFYTIAYLNLFLVFAVLLVIALWRWGIELVS